MPPSSYPLLTALAGAGGVWHDLGDRAPMRGVTYSPELGIWVAVGDNLPDIRTIVLDEDNGNGDDEDEAPALLPGARSSCMCPSTEA